MQAVGLDDIPVGQQKYSSTTLGDWGGIALTTSEASYNLELPKPTATTSNSYDDIYWMLKIPDKQQKGTYTGTNTVSVIDEMQNGIMKFSTV